MADIWTAMDMMCDAIVETIAPYQPNVPPLWPNPAPTAGQIPNTTVGVMEPIQVHLMERLENGFGHIAVFDVKEGKPIPFLDRFPSLVQYENKNPPAGTPLRGKEYVETARFEKIVYVQCFGPTDAARNKLGDLVMGFFGEAYRIPVLSDGTIILIRPGNFIDANSDQVDTLYYRTCLYRVDVTMTKEQDATQVIDPIANPVVSTVVPVTSKPPLTVNQL